MNCPRCRARLGVLWPGEPRSCVACGFEDYTDQRIAPSAIISSIETFGRYRPKNGKLMRGYQ